RSGALRRGDAADERMAGGAGDPADCAGHADLDADRLGQRDRRGRSAAAVRAWRAGETARPRSAPVAADDVARAADPATGRLRATLTTTQRGTARGPRGRTATGSRGTRGRSRTGHGRRSSTPRRA